MDLIPSCSLLSNLSSLHRTQPNFHSLSRASRGLKQPVTGDSVLIGQVADALEGSCEEEIRGWSGEGGSLGRSRVEPFVGI